MSDKSLSIRQAVIGDCAECAALLAGQLAEHGFDSSAAKLNQLLERVVSQSLHGFVLLAQDSSGVIGVAYCPTILSLEHGGPVAWLEELYVKPSHRDMGVGTALVGAVLEYASKSGMVAVDLEIDESHDRVKSLYRRFDFEILNRSRWVRRLSAGGG